LAAFDQRRTSFSSPYECIECQRTYAFRMLLGESRGAQRARGNSVEKNGSDTARLGDVIRHRGDILGAIRDCRSRAGALVRAPITTRIEAPGVEPNVGKPVHRRGIGTSFHSEVECRL